MAKKKRVRLTSPKGVAKYPWLNKPDVRFNADGVYTVTLLLSLDEASTLMEQLDELADQAVEKAKQDLIEKGKKAFARQVVRMEPFRMEYDDEGEETGMVEFRFKMKAKVKSKKDNSVIEFSPKLFDAKGQPIDPKAVLIYGGSTIKVNFTPNPYYVASSKGAGVSLQLNAVQVLELVSAGGDASFFGFETEDGFEITEKNDTPPFDTEESNITEEDF